MQRREGDDSQQFRFSAQRVREGRRRCHTRETSRAGRRVSGLTPAYRQFCCSAHVSAPCPPFSPLHPSAVPRPRPLCRRRCDAHARVHPADDLPLSPLLTSAEHCRCTGSRLSRRVSSRQGRVGQCDRTSGRWRWVEVEGGDHKGEGMGKARRGGRGREKEAEGTSLEAAPRGLARSKKAETAAPRAQQRMKYSNVATPRFDTLIHTCLLLHSSCVLNRDASAAGTFFPFIFPPDVSPPLSPLRPPSRAPLLSPVRAPPLSVISVCPPLTPAR